LLDAVDEQQLPRLLNRWQKLFTFLIVAIFLPAPNQSKHKGMSRAGDFVSIAAMEGGHI
jgi:hypothetical protein